MTYLILRQSYYYIIAAVSVYLLVISFILIIYDLIL